MRIPDFQRVLLGSFASARDMEAAADIRFPVLDDRGTRVASNARSTTRGPMVGIMQGYPIVVVFRRMRELRSAALHVTSSRAGDVVILGAATQRNDVLASLSATSGDGALSLPALGERGNRTFIALRSLNDVDADPVDIDVRYGSPTGTILASMSVLPLAKLPIRVKPHLVQVNGHTPNFTHDASGHIVGNPTSGPNATGVTTGFDVPVILRHAKAIWAAAGVELTWNATDETATSVITMTGSFADHVTGTREKLTLLADARRDQFAANLYFVQHDFTEQGSTPPSPIRDLTLGHGVSRAGVNRLMTTLMAIPNINLVLGTPQLPRPNIGILVGRASVARNPDGAERAQSSEAMGRTIAHELGHFFDLAHVVEEPLAPGETPVAGQPRLAPGGATMVASGGPHVWQLLRLMFPESPYDGRAEYRTQIGYGANENGQPFGGNLVSMKHLPGLGELDDTPESRRARAFIRAQGDAMFDMRNNPPAPPAGGGP